APHLQVRGVHTQHELGAGLDRRAYLDGVEGVHADAHTGRHELADHAAEVGKGNAGRAADVHQIGAVGAEALGGRADVRARHLRSVVDLGRDLDVPGAVRAGGHRAAEVGGDL